MYYTIVKCAISKLTVLQCSKNGKMKKLLGLKYYQTSLKLTIYIKRLLHSLIITRICIRMRQTERFSKLHIFADFWSLWGDISKQFQRPFLVGNWAIYCQISLLPTYLFDISESQIFLSDFKMDTFLPLDKLYDQSGKSKLLSEMKKVKNN